VDVNELSLEDLPKIILIKGPTDKKGHLFLNYISRSVAMPEHDKSAAATDMLTVRSDFDIFAHKPIQTSVLETIYNLQTYRPVE